MGGKTILLIENDGDIIENFQELLSVWGYNVLVASNGIEGLQKIRSENPDLILCDIDMPKMNGYQVLAETKKDKRFKKTPFIFLSASAQKGDIDQGKMAGVDDYLTKPISGPELQSLLTKFL